MRSALVHSLILSFTIFGTIFGIARSGSAAAQPSDSGTRLGPLAIAGDEPSYLDIAGGSFGSQPGHVAPNSASGRIEFRYGNKLFDIGPALGVLGTTRGAVFGYGGLYAELSYGHLVITPLGAVGAYRRGGDVELGGTFEFRLSLDAAYELPDRSRIGLQLGHISNAGIHAINPGENELLITYAIPLGLPR